MLNTWFVNTVELSTYAVITILLVVWISRLTGERYRPQWRYFIWLALALRLVLPVDWQLPQSIPVLTIPNIVFDQSASNSDSPISRIPSSPSGISTEAVDVGVSISTPDSATPGFSPDILSIVSWIWLLGAASYLFLRLINYYFTKRNLRDSLRPVGSRELTLISELKTAMGFNRCIGLYQSSLVSSPMLIGFTRPTILLPDIRLTDEQLALVLKHELTHAQRKDLWFMALMTLVAALHWFNPFIHWMVRMSYDDLEIICDSRVIKHADVRTRQVYANTIIQYMKNNTNPGSSLTTSFLGGDRIVKERFRMIFQNKPKKSAKWISCLLLVVILSGGTLVSCQSKTVQSNTEGSFSELYALFGSSDNQVFESLSLNADDDTDKTALGADSTDYLLKQPVLIHGHSSQVQLGFYNDTLMAIQYRFSNHQEAFDVSKALRKDIDKLHGQPSTIDGHPNRLDSLTELPIERTLPADYLEEWSITVDPQILTALFGNSTQSVNLDLRLSFIDESHAAVSVRYSMDRNSLQPPR